MRKNETSLFSFLLERLKNFSGKFKFRMHLIRHWSELGWFIDRATWEFGIPGRRLKPVPLEKVFPGIENQSEVMSFSRLWDRKRGTSIEVEELAVIASILKYCGSSNILEVGTYDGNTALNLALNVPETEGRVVTIDLPESKEPQLAISGARSNANPSHVIGRQLGHSEAASKVRMVREDTALLDWKSLPGPFDFIFIDGCHDYRYVKNDTEKAFGVLSGGGILIWHDYNLAGVGNYLDEFSQSHSCEWIQGTRLVVYR